MKRYEREIAELLEKMDDFIPDKAARRRKGPPRSRLFRLIRLVRSLNITSSMSITPASIFVAAVVLALLGLILRDLFRPAAPFASIASVCLLVAALALSYIRQRRHTERRWRGSIIDLEDYRSGSLFSKLRNRWRRFWNNLSHPPRDRY